MESENTIIELVSNPVKEYAWGRSDSNCLVAKTSHNTTAKFYA